MLPVLPLKETVVYPESMTPLAVGQERSIRLIDDVVVGGSGMPRCSRLAEHGTRATGLGRRLRDRDARRHPQDDQSARRHPPDPLVQGLERIRLAEPAGDDPYLLGGVRGAARRAAGLTRGRGADAKRPRPVRPDHRHDAVPPRGAAARGGERRRSERSLPPRRLDTAPGRRRSARTSSRPWDVEERLRKVSRILGRELEVSELGSKIQSQVASEIDKGQREALPPPAAQGDPGRAGRGRCRAGGGQRAPRADRGERSPGGRPQGGAPGALAAGAAASDRW